MATLYDLKAIANHDLNNTRILVKTGSNEESLRQLVDYFENEVYPVLPYEVEVGFYAVFYCRIIV